MQHIDAVSAWVLLILRQRPTLWITKVRRIAILIHYMYCSAYIYNIYIILYIIYIYIYYIIYIIVYIDTVSSPSGAAACSDVLPTCRDLVADGCLDFPVESCTVHWEVRVWSRGIELGWIGHVKNVKKCENHRPTWFWNLLGEIALDTMLHLLCSSLRCSGLGNIVLRKVTHVALRHWAYFLGERGISVTSKPGICWRYVNHIKSWYTLG